MKRSTTLITMFFILMAVSSCLFLLFVSRAHHIDQKLKEQRLMDEINRIDNENKEEAEAVRKIHPDPVGTEDSSGLNKEEIKGDSKEVEVEEDDTMIHSEFSGLLAERPKCYPENRNMDEYPFAVSGWFKGEAYGGCDVPCQGISFGDTRLGVDASNSMSRSTTIGCPFSFQFTMENRPYQEDSNVNIQGTTELSSDLPMLYPSYEEYNFMRRPKNKTATAMVAAFISNCGPRYRLKYLRELMDAGVTVHSYGRCMHNFDMPGAGRHGPSWQQKKEDLIQTYKFTFAFENSETDDYVTEKLFGPYCAGSIPIYKGAPNAKKFSIAPKSTIWADDFSSPQEMAKFLLMLDKDDAKYNEYLTWKNEGVSKSFLAIVDIAIVHSNCRLCIRVGDLYRKTYGQLQGGPHQQSNKIALTNRKPGQKLVRMRERGKFWMRNTYLKQSITISELREHIKTVFKNEKEKFPIYQIQNLWDRKHTPITTSDQVSSFMNQEKREIEIVFEFPGNPERKNYYDWWKTNKA